jgi:hypothetical protein
MRANNACVSFTISTHCFMILSVAASADRIIKHGVVTADRIMKYGVVVNEARSNVQSIRTTVGLKAGDHEL